MSEKPLGHSKKYRVVTSPESREKMRGWLKTRGGIAVWVNQDLSGGPLNSNCGHLVFTPGTHLIEVGGEEFRPVDPIEDRPHWAYALVEVVTDESRLEWFQEEVRTAPCPNKLKAEERRSMVGWTYSRAERFWWRHVPMP